MGLTLKITPLFQFYWRRPRRPSGPPVAPGFNYLPSVIALLIAILNPLGASADYEDKTCLGNGHGRSCLVTGNGFGYAVVDPVSGDILKHWAKPASAEGPDPQDPDEGISPSNFLRKASWQNPAQKKSTTVHYAQQSHVIQVDGPERTDSTFMPFGIKRSTVVTTTSQLDAKTCLHTQWDDKIEKVERRWLNDREVRIYKFKNLAETLVAVPLASQAKTGSEACLSGAQGYALASLKGQGKDLENDLKAAVAEVIQWQGQTPAKDLAAREIAEYEKTRIHPVSCFQNQQEKDLWRQSETTLKIAQLREANNEKNRSYGLINASLPDGEFFMPFVRDMAYATTGLVRSGHQKEARDAVSSYLNAGPIGIMKKEVRNQDYQISAVRYFGNGAEEADKSGQKVRNLELDNWGLSLWAMGEYFDKYQDKEWLQSQTLNGPAYNVIRDKIVKPLLVNTDPTPAGLIIAKDNSCWEQNNEERRHYAATTIAAIGGLMRFQNMAKAMHDEATFKEVGEKLSQLKKGFNAAFVRDGWIHGVVEHSPKNEMDGFVFEAINMGVVTDAKVIAKTLDKASELKAQSGGYFRVKGGPDEYEHHEFLFTNFSLARAYLRAGRNKEADELINHMVEKSAKDNHLIPEMYVSRKNSTFIGAIGSPAGASPMVGYGAGLYQMYLSERQAQQEGRLTAQGEQARPIGQEAHCPRARDGGEAAEPGRPTSGTH